MSSYFNFYDTRNYISAFIPLFVQKQYSCVSRILSSVEFTNNNVLMIYLYANM